MRPGWTGERLHGQTSCPQRSERHHWLQTEGGKVLCVQQHPYVQVIGSLAFASLFKILWGVDLGNPTRCRSESLQE